MARAMRAIFLNLQRAQTLRLAKIKRNHSAKIAVFKSVAPERISYEIESGLKTGQF